MFGSEILDTVIGLAFVYLLLSLTCSVVVEMISSLFNMRGATLKQAIRQMVYGTLSGDITLGFERTSKLTKSPPIDSQTGVAWSGAESPKNVDDFYSHSLIRPLFDTAYFWWKRSPSYIDSRTFAMVLLDKVLDYGKDPKAAQQAAAGAGKVAETNQAEPDKSLPKTIKDIIDALPTSPLKGRLQQVLKERELPSAQELDYEMRGKFRELEAAVAKLAEFSPELKQLSSALQPIITAAKSEATNWEGAYDKMLAGIEKWFDSNMKRVSGWYGRQAKAITFVVALLIVVVFNVDSLAIARSLYTDTAQRAALVGAATAFVQQAPAAAPAAASSEAGEAGNEPPSAAAGEQPSEPTAPLPKQSLEELLTQIQALDVPIGWVVCKDLNAYLCTPWIARILGTPETPAGESGVQAFDESQVYPIGPERLADKMVGLILTVLMLSLGAPFWFDMLNKLVNLRASGAAPEPASKKS